MRIYIVRHGETQSNAEKIRQSSGGYLSDDGIQEARAAASKLSSLKIDSIFTSSYPRAKQTADIISALGKGLLVQESEYLTEVKLPSEVVGKPVNDPASKKIFSWLQSHSISPTARFSDEETYNEYVSRAHKVLSHIEKTGFENTVIVTHHRFIHILVAVVLMGKQLTPELFNLIRNHIYISNTGITIIEKNEEKEGAWYLLTLNEHSHLENATFGSSH